MMALSDVTIRKAKPADKDYKLRDTGNLYLLVKKSGSKYWRFDYRFEGKRQTLALGIYPDVSLKDVRERHTEARRLLSNGINPSAKKQADKRVKSEQAENSFEVIAREWHVKQSPKWSPNTAKRIIQRLEQHIFPWLSKKPIADIIARDVLEVVRRIEAQGKNETAQRCLNYCSQVFRYAVATARLERDCTYDLRGALAPIKVVHRAAITAPSEIAPLLRAIHDYEGEFITRCAIRLLPLVFTRPGELRNAEWSEIDLEGALWSIPASKMKMSNDHLVPLSRQSVAILEEIKPLTQLNSRYVFPSLRTNDRPISDNTLNAALRRMGYSKEQMTAHGFRAMARTNLDEVLRFRFEVIEMQLAHAVRDANGRAYNRTQYLEERRGMMQAWADWLDKLQHG